jgi:hypothetical protein
MTSPKVTVDEFFDILKASVSGHLGKQKVWHPEDIAYAVSIHANATGSAFAEGWRAASERKGKHE